MYYYKKDSYGFLAQETTESAIAQLLPGQYHSSETQLELELTWTLNDYKCFRYAIVNEELVENEIVLYVDRDINDFIVGAYVGTTLETLIMGKYQNITAVSYAIAETIFTENPTLNMLQTRTIDGYKCHKWQFKNGQLRENIVNSYAVINADNHVIGRPTMGNIEKELLESGISMAPHFTNTPRKLPIGITDIILTQEQALLAETGQLTNHSLKIQSGAVISIPDNEILDKLKLVRDASLKAEYMSDIKWHDDAEIYYPQKKILLEELIAENPSNEVYPINLETLNAWKVDADTYWKESQLKRMENKVQISAASTRAELTAILFNPSHIKSKEELA